jgi:hypothetical protein
MFAAAFAAASVDTRRASAVEVLPSMASMVVDDHSPFL